MLATIKREWQALKKGRPGTRFQQRAERAKRDRAKQSTVKRLARPAIGVVLLVAGVIFCLIPGPGLPLIFIGAALLAEQSRPAARFLDWLEIRARKSFGWGKRWWHRATAPAKAAVLVFGVAVLMGAGYGAYWVTFRQ